MDLNRFDVTDYGPILERFRAFSLGGEEETCHSRAWTCDPSHPDGSKPKVRYVVVQQRFKNWTVPMASAEAVVDRLIGNQFGLVKK